MKLSWGAILSSLYCSAQASNQGHVFLFDPVAKAAPASPPAVSPETARLILAQRLGLARFHAIKHVNDQVIDQINTFGGRPQRFFQGKNVPDRNDAHLLVWVEDADDVKSIVKDTSAYSSAFTITTPPSTSDNDRLVQDFIAQVDALPKNGDAMGWAYQTGVEIESALKPVKQVDTHKDYLSIVRANKADNKAFAELSSALHELLQKASTAGEKSWAITVVVMPPSSSTNKRTAHPYGTYDLPRSIEARREKTEAPMSLYSPQSQPSVQAQSPNSHVFESEAPVLGILPACFETLDACNKQTHGCSGHGNCTLVRKAKAGSDTKINDCYGCKCKATSVHVGEDKGMESHFKTTYWGGPACQKKDVSVPFWLFVGAGVILAGLVSASIGMLYSMGSEELPSVIGAGVSGPTKK